MSTFDTETKRNAFFAARDGELDRFIDPATGRIPEDLLETIPCRLCGEPAYDRLFVKNGFDFVRCRACTLVYVNPQLKASAILASYGDDLPSNDAALAFLSSPRQQEVDRDLYAAMFEKIREQVPSGDVLDVGCSFGLFLKTAKDLGYRVRGLELNEKAARYGQEHLGVSIEPKLLEDCRFPDASFDVVAMFGVIEHLPRPVETVREIYRILKPGGMFVGRCPNVQGLVCMVLHGTARTFSGRVHLSYFSKRTLGRLLTQECGFRRADIDTFVSGKDSLLNHFQFLDPFGDETQEFLPDELRAFLADKDKAARLEQAINELGLGYKLRFFAYK